MRFNTDTIVAAFERHEAIYHSKKAWNIGYHIQCWNCAHTAFEGTGSFDDFFWIYDQLHRYWQVFRKAAGPYWTPNQTHRYLLEHASHWRRLSLIDLCDEHMPTFDSLVGGMCGIKPTTSGPSIVAISKFLHFMNPRLFVIVDDAVIWRWVLAHRWLKNEFVKTRTKVARLLNQSTPVGAACDVLSYIAVVRWCSELLITNPEIIKVFDDHVRRHNGGNTLPRAVEAAAVEWFLLGVVELPPAGVTFS